MGNIVRGGIVQATNVIAPTADTSGMSKEDIRKELKQIKDAMNEKHVKLLEEAAEKGCQVVCFQELFNGPYFCAEHHMRWYDYAESVPGPTVDLFAREAAKHGIVLVLSIYEKETTGVYYNTAVVVDGDGTILGKYRKNHIPYVHPGFYEKYYFKPGNLGYPVFETGVGKVAVYICYDRHFPDGARILGLHGAEIVFNPSATTEGVSKYLWELEQPAHAVANGYFMGNINRVGWEEPWKSGRFYGESYFCNPKGKIISQGSGDKDEVIVADMDLDEIQETRNAWAFYRDRRPETYGDLVKLLP